METLMWNVLTVSAKMTVVLLPVLLLSPLLDRTYAAKWKVFIYVLLGIRLLIPFSISLPSAPLQVAAPQQAFERPVLLWSAPSDPVKSRTFTEEQSQSAQTSQPGQAAVQTPQSRTGQTAHAGLRAGQLAGMIWAAGVMVFLLWQFGAYALFARSARKRSAPASRQLAAAFEQACLQTPPRRRVTLRESDLPGSPMLLGFARPVLLLPRGEYTKEELSFIFAHELTHCRYFHVWVKLLLVLANALHWFHPLVWLMRRSAGADLERCCDDAVLRGLPFQERRAYSEAILAAISRPAGRQSALATDFDGGKKTMKLRFVNILSKKNKKNGLALLLGVLLLAGLAGGLVACNTSSTRDYTHDGLVVPFPKDFYKEVELTPTDELGEDVVLEVYHKQSKKAFPEGGFLFRIVKKTDAQWEDYYIPASEIGGVTAFARGEGVVYAVERPTDVQADLSAYEAYAALEERIPALLEQVIEKNGLAAFAPHVYDDPYVALFAGTGMAQQSWDAADTMPSDAFCNFFPLAYAHEGGDLEQYATDERGVGEYAIPADLFEGLLMRYFDVTPAFLRTMSWYDGATNTYRNQFNASGPDWSATTLSYEEKEGGLVTIRYNLVYHDPDFTGGLREVTIEKTGQDKFRYVCFSMGEELLWQVYYDYFEQHSRQLTPLFSLPSGDPQIDNDNLMIFALQNLTLTDQETGVSKAEIDKVLQKYFGRTVTSYETGVAYELPSGNIGWRGFSFHGSVRLVPKSIWQQSDGSKMGVFDVYELPEDDLSGYGGYTAVLERLRSGDTAGLEELYEGEVTIVFDEIPDADETLGFYVRYRSILYASATQRAAQSLYFYNGALLGSHDEQGWHSLCELEGERAYGSDGIYTAAPDVRHKSYTANDLLAPSVYYLYEDHAFVGHSDWLLWTSDVGGLGSFENERANEILAAHATPYQTRPFGDMVLHRMQLPGTLYEEGASLLIPTYSFVSYFGRLGMDELYPVGQGNRFLATNANHDLASAVIEQLDGSQYEIDSEVKRLFERAGMGNTRPNVTAAQRADFDGDGQMETLYTVATPRDEGGWPLIEGEGTTGNVGTFALLLYEETDGTVQVVFSDLRPYQNGEAVTFTDGLFSVDSIDYSHTIAVEEIVDLNDDGKLELIATCGLWEGGYGMAFALDNDRYEVVMRSNWGS